MPNYHQEHYVESRNGSMEQYETRSTASGKSNRSSSRSSVLERARAYNRKVEEKALQKETRAKSLERGSPRSSDGGGGTPRSRSVGRTGGNHIGNRVASREHARASVPDLQYNNSNNSSNNNSNDNERYQPKQQRSRPITPITSDYNQQQQQRIRNDPPQTRQQQQQQQSKPQAGQEAGGDGNNNVVTPELLVDALSGHEDGLLAIAEKLMEHYDQGYDVMGEAIIDAFADVQKLFQHVVEAAHMEGAAFESQRREGEIAELKKQLAAGGVSDGLNIESIESSNNNNNPMLPNTTGGGISSPGGGPARHDEFIDQDVKEVLTEAIRKGVQLRENNEHMKCYQLYETACNSASSLLPVDSDHRGRLQLSIARADSMSPDRACAILRYAMDDVLRSGQRALQNKQPTIDVSKRGDCVLDKPKGHPSIVAGNVGVNANGSISSSVNLGNVKKTSQAGVIQSSEEALASLVEEMKEVLNAPIYDNTPLQSVAERFWIALSEAQRSNIKQEEQLEQSLGKLKGDYLLARAEWEEKITKSQETADYYKRKYTELKQESGNTNISLNESRDANMSYELDQSRVGDRSVDLHSTEFANNNRGYHNNHSTTGSRSGNDDASNTSGFINTSALNTTIDSVRSRISKSESVASLGSGLAQSAKSIVSSFQCVGSNVPDNFDNTDRPYINRRSRSAPRSPRHHYSDNKLYGNNNTTPSNKSNDYGPPSSLSKRQQSYRSGTSSNNTRKPGTGTPNKILSREV